MEFIRNLLNVQNIVTVAIISLIILSLYLITGMYKVNFLGAFKRSSLWLAKHLFRASSKFINSSETKYNRDYSIGKLDEKRKKVKLYRFLNELTIDLEIKQYGITPYELLFITVILTALATLLICQLLFHGLLMSIPLFPIVLTGVLCVMYTKANVAHDTRIEAVYEAENIICNNITSGVVVAVRSSIDVMPKQVKEEFVTFLDNVEHKNYHIKTALLELNSNLGSVSDDFIKKCIVFETEEEHGISGMFKDVVEINNIKMELRTEMKRQFEKVTTDFVVSIVMIFIFLGGVVAIYPDVRSFYFTNPIGQLIIAIDILIIIAEYVFITWLRAREL